ncbi:hypothetical protein AAG906_036847 [Vitis piasezkii]
MGWLPEMVCRKLGVGDVWCFILLFVHSLDYARTRLANDAKAQRGKERDNSMAWLMPLGKPQVSTVLLGFTVIQYFTCWDHCIPWSPLWNVDSRNQWSHRRFADSFFASFALDWLITNGAGLASYPMDTVRRMMMSLHRW